MQFLAFLVAFVLFLASAVASPAPMIHVPGENVGKRQISPAPCDGYFKAFSCAQSPNPVANLPAGHLLGYSCIQTNTCSGPNRYPVFCCLRLTFDPSTNPASGTWNCNPTSTA